MDVKTALQKIASGRALVIGATGYAILRQIPLTSHANPGMLVNDGITDRLAKALIKRGYTAQPFGTTTPNEEKPVNLTLDQAKAVADLATL